MEKTWKPTAAGICSMLGGVGNLIFGLMFTVLGGITLGVFGMGWLSAIGVPALICGIIAIVGGIFALQRRSWVFALIGAICAFIGPGFVLGILAIIFVIMGKGEFK